MTRELVMSNNQELYYTGEFSIVKLEELNSMSLSVLPQSVEVLDLDTCKQVTIKNVLVIDYSCANNPNIVTLSTVCKLIGGVKESGFEVLGKHAYCSINKALAGALKKPSFIRCITRAVKSYTVAFNMKKIEEYIYDLDTVTLEGKECLEVCFGSAKVYKQISTSQTVKGELVDLEHYTGNMLIEYRLMVKLTTYDSADNIMVITPTLVTDKVKLLNYEINNHKVNNSKTLCPSKMVLYDTLLDLIEQVEAADTAHYTAKDLTGKVSGEAEMMMFLTNLSRLVKKKSWKYVVELLAQKVTD